ncbi:hypothetical protein BN946_scf185042.g101 [Trametes cinnabarina]|uniref:SET domain-containing protein n=1 Tax=Pycnoporus cinnabarinus TaxID=5643 RepID=A0A060SA83_PYCCI|nr:hypothetical protein BN946_scf185042.g101 [Trametes cinnabarina]
MVDEIASTPQSPVRRRSLEKNNRPDMGPPTSQPVHRPTFVEGSSTGGQPSSSAPRKPPSLSQTRRPLSDSGSDDDKRPKKKRKKMILDPEIGIASARTRASLEGQLAGDATRPIQLSHLPFAVFSVALKSSDALREARRKRRVTMDVGILAAGGTQSMGSQAARRSNADAPLQRAKARRKSTNSTGTGTRLMTGEGGALCPNGKNPPQTSAAPSQLEVIEILDSDDEPPRPPLSLPKAPAKPSAPPPKPDIPRRTKYRPNSVLRYREDDNGVILLSSDSDEPPAPANLPAKSPQTAPAKRFSQHSPRRSSPRVLRPISPQPDSTFTGVHAVRAPSVSQAALQADMEDPAVLTPNPSPVQQGVEMAEEQPPDSNIVHRHSPADGPYISEEQHEDITTSVHPKDGPSDLPKPDLDVMQVEPTVLTGETIKDFPTPESAIAPSPLVEEPMATEVGSPEELTVSRAELAGADPCADVSSSNGPQPEASPLQAGSKPFVQPHPVSSSLVSASSTDQVPALELRLPAWTLEMRSETASPVSSALDPPLQQLAISGTPRGGHSGQHTPPFSIQLLAAAQLPQVVLDARLASPLDLHDELPAIAAKVSEKILAPAMEVETSINVTSEAKGDGPVQPDVVPGIAEKLPVASSVGHEPIDQNLTTLPGALFPTNLPSSLLPEAPAVVPALLDSAIDDQSTNSQLHVKLSDQGSPVLQEQSLEGSPAHTGQLGGNEKVNRGDTPPVGYPPDKEPRTLSQIIRKAVIENARKEDVRKEVIDLTSDDAVYEAAENGKHLHVTAQEVVSAGPSATSVAQPSPATPVSQHVKTVDLSAIRNTWKMRPRLPQLSPSKLGDKTFPPLPRNLRRPPSFNKSTDAASPAASAIAHCAPVPNPSPDLAPAAVGAPASPTPLVPSCQPSHGPSSQEPLKLILPRRRDLMKRIRLLPPGPPTGSPEITADTDKTTAVADTGSPGARSPSPLHVHEIAALGDTAQPGPVVIGEADHEEATPPRPSSPEAMEEEECLSLIYPDTAEGTPEVQMAGERELDHAPLVQHGRHTRSQATSDASSEASGPRRSARLTSNSASSSVEPAELPVSRSRRYRPYVRTHSDERVASQGEITRQPSHSFIEVFSNAGFEAISWQKDRKRIATEFAPVMQLAKDIPHDLHDRLNSLSLAARQAGSMQVLVFEAEIQANTAQDEPDAPPIYIVNEVDDEPTPPLEFYYSNLMWHGEGVPKPDHDNLQGCDCVGPCDPTSKTCACVQRQRKYWDGGSSGFIYDRKGKLRQHEYPIFECNMNCSCSEDCMNRVVQLGRQFEIAICKTLNKGWGVFAGTKKIPANSYVGIYAGEYLTDHEGEVRGTTYLFDLDFWFLNEEGMDRKVKYCIDAYHAGNFTRYLNHSCEPNCVINACYINEANLDKPLLAIFTCRDVEPYEELCFSYYGQSDDDMGIDTKPDKGDAVYVTCQCGAVNCRGTMWK